MKQEREGTKSISNRIKTELQRHKTAPFRLEETKLRYKGTDQNSKKRKLNQLKLIHGVLKLFAAHALLKLSRIEKKEQREKSEPDS